MSQKTFMGLQLFSGSIQYSPSPMESHKSRMSLHERGAIKISKSTLKLRPINAACFCSTKSQSYCDITRGRPIHPTWKSLPNNTSLHYISDNKEISLIMRGSRDGAVVRGLPPKFLCPSLIPGPGVTSESSLLSVLVLALRVFTRIFQLFSLYKN